MSTCFGSLVSFFIFFRSFSNKSPNFFAPFIFLAFFSILTSVLYKKIQIGLIKFLFEEENLQNNLPVDVLPMPSSQTSCISLKTKIIKALKNPPKTLIQLSSSYFKPVPENFDKKKRSFSQIVNGNPVFLNKKSKSSVITKNKEYSLTENSEFDKCFLCFDKACNAVFMDCGHGGLCFECAVKVKLDCGLCHICRGGIVQVLMVVKVSGGNLEVVKDDFVFS